MSAKADKQRIEARRYNQSKLASQYEEYYDKIVRYAYVHIGNRTEAEDIAGEVFLKALESLKSYEDRGIPMQAWLFRIAHNLVVDHLRKAAKRKTVPIDIVQAESDDNPVTAAEKNIELERVTKAMEQLTREQREVLGLRFFGGLTSKEAGSILNKSDGAVREMQRAAIEKLRKLLVTD
jgi:RNA polymerase sigma-70 factor (ECF subfamily)